jgi:hypothetical protein
MSACPAAADEIYESQYAGAFRRPVPNGHPSSHHASLDSDCIAHPFFESVDSFHICHILTSSMQTLLASLAEGSVVDSPGRRCGITTGSLPHLHLPSLNCRFSCNESLRSIAGKLLSYHCTSDHSAGTSMVSMFVQQRNSRTMTWNHFRCGTLSGLLLYVSMSERHMSAATPRSPG